ncbi:MAG: hypothetical protein ACUVTF_08270 [bacterium]
MNAGYAVKQVILPYELTKGNASAPLIIATNTSMTLRTYFYWIKYDQGGIYIGKGAPVDPNIIPRKYVVLGRRPINTPTNLQAKEIPFNNNIKITWQDNSHNELKFKI